MKYEMEYMKKEQRIATKAANFRKPSQAVIIVIL